jgi:hypothetical protein
MMPWLILLPTAAVVIPGIGAWAWKALPVSLDFKFGPGVRSSATASLTVHHEPHVAPVSLPELPYIKDDIKYLEEDVPRSEPGSTLEEIERRDRVGR